MQTTRFLLQELQQMQYFLRLIAWQQRPVSTLFQALTCFMLIAKLFLPDAR